MTVAVRGKPWLEISCRISHFGINPVKGGRPPNESKIRQASAVKAGALVQAEAKVMVLVEFTFSRVRKAAAVITMYVIKARRVMLGAIWATKIIHPRWATDE